MKERARRLFRRSREDSTGGRLIRGATGSFLIRVIATGLSLLVAIVLARTLGVKGFGVYSFVLSVVSVLAIPATLGLRQLSLREVSANLTRAHWGTLRGILRASTVSVTAASLILAALAGIAVGLLRDADLLAAAGGDATAFWMALPLLLAASLTHVYGTSLRSLGYIVAGQLDQLLRPGLFLIFVGAAFLFTGRLEPEHAVAMQVAAAVATLAVIARALWRALPHAAKDAPARYDARYWVRSAWPLLVVSTMQVVNQQASTLLLGAMTEAAEVGLYRVAQRGAMLVTFALQSVNMAMAPTVSRLYTRGELDGLQRAIAHSARAVAAYSVPVCIALALSARWLVPWLFGAEFAPAALPLLILSVAHLGSAAAGSVGLVLNMTGHERETAAGIGFAALLTVGLNAALIPLWHSTGAALASGIAMVAWKVFLARRVYTRLGIHTSVFHALRRAARA